MTAAKTANGHVNGSTPPADVRPVTVPDFLAARSRGVRLTMLTAYDYIMAQLLDAAGVDGLLVGDSLGMVFQGQEHSLSVTLEEVIYHSTAYAGFPAASSALSVAAQVVAEVRATPQD